MSTEAGEIQGTTDPVVLADLAQGKLRAKIPALREALEGRFEAHHALVIGAILAHLDFLDEQIQRLGDAIEEQLGPFGLAGVELASTIPGVARRTAEVLVAEIGTNLLPLPRASGAAFAGGLVVARAAPSPGREVARRGEDAHVWLGSTWIGDARRVPPLDSDLNGQPRRRRWP